MNQDPESTANRASSIFRSIDELAEAIRASKTFGMRDITVTTVHRPTSESARGDHIPQSTEYHLDCRMIGDKPETERQLAHLSETRRVLEEARSTS